VTRESFRLTALSELIQLKYKGLKEAWLFGCWVGYKKGFLEYRESAEEFERLFIEAYEAGEPAICRRLAVIFSREIPKRRSRKTSRLREDVLPPKKRTRN
jgi:hypothetical protein